MNPADAPILTLALTRRPCRDGGARSRRDAAGAEDLPGGGGRPRQHRRRPAPGRAHRFNARALAAYGLNIDDLRTTITNLNVNTPKGTIDGPTQSYAINANDQIRDPKAYDDAIIAYKNGAPVRLSDVADVVNGPENTKLGAWMDETPPSS